MSANVARPTPPARRRQQHGAANAGDNKASAIAYYVFSALQGFFCRKPSAGQLETLRPEVGAPWSCLNPDIFSGPLRLLYMSPLRKGDRCSRPVRPETIGLAVMRLRGWLHRSTQCRNIIPNPNPVPRPTVEPPMSETTEWRSTAGTSLSNRPPQGLQAALMPRSRQICVPLRQLFDELQPCAAEQNDAVEGKRLRMEIFFFCYC